jgi:hypothetical protein
LQSSDKTEDYETLMHNLKTDATNNNKYACSVRYCWIAFRGLGVLKKEESKKAVNFKHRAYYGL